ncbi:MAG: CDP-diacylglycerol--serine O-phosphatidyltransferase [bacterium]
MRDRLKGSIQQGLHRRRAGRRRRRGRRSFKRGIFLLPNLLTTGSLFAGFYAIVAAIQSDFWWASLAILIAIALDGLDGVLARLTKTSSPFGLQYDSLCDLTAFGIAPAVLIFTWALAPFGRVGWLAAFVFAACGALRLARFNVLAQAGEGTSDFRGLPIPAAGGVLASVVFLVEDISVRPYVPVSLVAAVAYILAFLMVSTIRYRTFKKLEGPLKQPFRVLVGSVLALFVAAAIPQVVACLFLVGYAASGPALLLSRGRRAKKAAAPPETTASPESP